MLIYCQIFLSFLILRFLIAVFLALYFLSYVKLTATFDCGSVIQNLLKVLILLHKIVFFILIIFQILYILLSLSFRNFIFFFNLLLSKFNLHLQFFYLLLSTIFNPKLLNFYRHLAWIIIFKSMLQWHIFLQYFMIRVGFFRRRRNIWDLPFLC